MEVVFQHPSNTRAGKRRNADRRKEESEQRRKTPNRALQEIRMWRTKKTKERRRLDGTVQPTRVTCAALFTHKLCFAHNKKQEKEQPSTFPCAIAQKRGKPGRDAAIKNVPQSRCSAVPRFTVCSARSEGSATSSAHHIGHGYWGRKSVAVQEPTPTSIRPTCFSSSCPPFGLSRFSHSSLPVKRR